MSKNGEEEKAEEKVQEQAQEEKSEKTEVEEGKEKEEENPEQNDVDDNKTEPSASASDHASVENAVKSPGLEYLVEAMLSAGNSASRSPQSAVYTDHQLKRNQDERINACKKIMGYVNSVDFSTLNDKEIRTFLMIREISCAVIIGQRKLPTDHDVSRVLKDSIERMVVACRKMVDQISGMDFHDLNEQEKQSLTMILKIAREIISKQGAQYEDDI